LSWRPCWRTMSAMPSTTTATARRNMR
jgi:hypothetical protein